MSQDLPVSSVPQDIVALAQRATGRCHSCARHRTFELPTRTIHFCSAYHLEMTAEQSESVRDCEAWRPFQPLDRSRRDRAANNPILRSFLDAEDALFAALKQQTDYVGVDLKSLLMLSQPSIDDVEDLSWVDTLDVRFPSIPPTPMTSIIEELRRHHYDALCTLLEGILHKFGEPA